MENEILKVKSFSHLRQAAPLIPPKRFLFLQGPHGPFYRDLAKALQKRGHAARRIGFNAADRLFWSKECGFDAFNRPIAAWSGFLKSTIARYAITDLVIYNDTRPIHAEAVRIAKELNLTLHCFEEGYLRPYWITYERAGLNGYSPLNHISIDQMRDALEENEDNVDPAPGNWGALKQHIFFGALYHGYAFLTSSRFPHFQSHRNRSVSQEFRSHFMNLLQTPVRAYLRRMAERRIRLSDFQYDVVLLQLDHDASICFHSPIDNMVDLMETCIRAFARSADPDRHLVIKAHPLEDYYRPLYRSARNISRRFGVFGRVHFVHGGKLSCLLDEAHSVVTINSTAGQQALWRGLPLKALGDAIYNKPELVSEQNLDAFFKNPTPPDRDAYRCFRSFLMRSSQINGSYYTKIGREKMLASVVTKMLADEDPYELELKDRNEKSDPLVYIAAANHR